MGRKFAEFYLRLAIFFNPLSMLVLFPLYARWINGFSETTQVVIIIIYSIIDLAAVPVFFCINDMSEKPQGLSGHRQFICE